MKYYIICIIIALLVYLYINNNVNNGEIITVENFIKAETHMYIKKYFDKIHKTNTFYHYRDFVVDNAVVRMNLDTLYSIAIVDSLKDDIEIIIPDVNDRYISCCILDEEHYEVLFTRKGGKYNIPKSDKYSVCLIRILVKNKSLQEEIKLVNKIQDDIKIISKNYSSDLMIPDIDVKSYKHTKDLVNKLFQTAPNMSSIGMFGKRGEVNELKHIMGVNMGWGGLSEKYAFYESIFPKKNDGYQEYTLTFTEIPVYSFWSIIIYDKEGFIIMDGNQSLNNFTAKKTNNSYIINFSNDPNKINQLNIVDGWNFTVRMYDPKKEILNGNWKLPDLIEVN